LDWLIDLNGMPAKAQSKVENIVIIVLKTKKERRKNNQSDGQISREVIHDCGQIEITTDHHHRRQRQPLLVFPLLFSSQLGLNPNLADVMYTQIVMAKRVIHTEVIQSYSMSSDNVTGTGCGRRWCIFYEWDFFNIFGFLAKAKVIKRMEFWGAKRKNWKDFENGLVKYKLTQILRGIIY
jgi:hypothetical protein